MQEAAEVSGGYMVESFVCEEEGDVVRRFGTGDDPGGRVLDDLQSVDEFGGESGEEGAAAVDSELTNE